MLKLNREKLKMCQSKLFIKNKLKMISSLTVGLQTKKCFGSQSKLFIKVKVKMISSLTIELQFKFFGSQSKSK